VERHYPYEERWNRWLRTRPESERPQFGTAESLDDLRGLDRDMAALRAADWWHTYEHTDEIIREQATRRAREQESERKRLILLARKALDGKLGESASDRDDARSTAQTFLRQAPEHCSDDDLSDWMLMHQYAKQLSAGRKVPRPVLARDRREQERKQRELDDINRTIDAAPAGRPQQRRAEQRELYG
jgi:hypothetical protein